jgi:hypothetical protein
MAEYEFVTIDIEEMLEEQLYLRVEGRGRNWWVVSDMYPKNEHNYYGMVADGFRSRAEAEK